MVLSRRNVLVGLGAIVGGGGALVGTGAFSTVSATRSVDVSTAGDATGQIGLVLNPPLGGSDGNDTINISVNKINLDAVTTFNEALEITNNSTEDGGVPVTIDIRDPVADVSLIQDPTNASSSDPRLMFYNDDDDDGDGNSPDDNTIGSGKFIEYNVVFNTTGSTDNSTVSGNSDYFPQEITIVAEQA